MTNKNKIAWEVALAGLQRFYTEGMHEWSKSNFVKLLHGDTDIAESDYVQHKLKELSDAGKITFVDSDEVYFIIKSI